MARAYCFTINNYNTDGSDEKILQEAVPGKIRYVVLGFEIGASGTPHIQGYLELHKPARLAAMKKLHPTAHWETRKGTRDQARYYCMKDNVWKEYGEWKAGGQGARNDLRGLMQAIKEGKPTLEIMEEQPEAYARNLRFCEKYERLVEKETTKAFRKVTVEAYVGDAGTGKTRKAMQENPDIFTVNCEDNFPFDGYNGETAILIDDFEGTMKYHQLLRVLDGHQYRCNVKGGHRYARWTKVIITSNKQPSEWYQRGLTPALKRRLNSVTTFRNEEAGGNTEAPALIDGLE